MYHCNSQISFGGAFDRYKGEVSIQKLPISSFFHSYPITLFGWYIVYLSPHKRAELTQHSTTKARFPIVDHLMAIKEKCPLANCLYQIFSATPTLLPSLDGTSPLRNPTGPHQRPKSTQRTTAKARIPPRWIPCKAGSSRHLHSTWYILASFWALKRP